MATRIPLPGNGAEYLQKGVESGANLWQQLLGQGLRQAQMHQQWQQHLRNAAIREQQEERLRALQPHLIREYENKAEAHPLELDKLRAQIEKEQQAAKLLEKGGRQRVTAAIQEADVLFDRDDPRHAQYILNKSKQYMPTDEQMVQDEKLKQSPDYEKIAPYLENAVDMNNLSPGSQNLYRKEMNNELMQIDKAKQVQHAISRAREITKANPNLYRNAVNIIANPEGNPTSTEKALTALLPKKDVAAFMELSKLYSDILTKQAQLNNMSRSVYALRLQQQAKAQVKNPDEVNEQIFKNIEYEIAPQLDREKALIYAMKHNKYLPYTKEYPVGSVHNAEISSDVHSPTQMGMMKGIDKQGREHQVHPSQKERFIRAGGKIL